MANVRDSFLRVAFAIVVVTLTSSANAQYVSRNINMVSGTQWPGGDPFLQRQNEPSMAVSTRNPLHILAGANDYRTVDLPGLPDSEETGDAWLGLFISLDGGLTFRSTLVPGFPQDTTAPAEPVHQSVNGITFNAAADPMVRSGLNGMFYYSGIAMRRPATPASPTISGVFVARYNDFNDREASNPIRYLGMSMVADGRNGSRFLDKPSLAVDIPRFGSSPCTVGAQTILGGNAYVVYTEITPAAGATTGAKLWFSRSTDCGSTWSSPITISGNNTLNQGSVIAIDTRNGNVYVVWRRIASGSETNALLVAKSVDGGKTFSTPVVIRNIVPYEQEPPASLSARRCIRRRPRTLMAVCTSHGPSAPARRAARPAFPICATVASCSRVRPTGRRGRHPFKSRRVLRSRLSAAVGSSSCRRCRMRP